MLDHVTGKDLDNSRPMKSSFELYNADFVPSLPHHQQLFQAMIPLVARVIVEEIPAFSEFKKVITMHIPHRYKNEMAGASQQVDIVISHF